VFSLNPRKMTIYVLQLPQQYLVSFPYRNIATVAIAKIHLRCMASSVRNYQWSALVVLLDKQRWLPACLDEKHIGS